jgi:hypothetical protein
MANHETQFLSGLEKHAVPRLVPALVLLVLALVASSSLSAQTPPEVVGHVDGQNFKIEAPQSGPATIGPADVLTSGSRLIARAGQTRVSLNGGGEIIICGAARLQLLKSQGALTVALDYGTLRVRIEGAESVAVFTPLVTATPVAIGGGERDTTIGLEQNGQMCLRALSGAVRIAQQLSGQSLLVPQYGGLSLSGGQLNPIAAGAPGCSCELDTAKLLTTKPLVTHEASGTGTTPAAKPPSQTQPIIVDEKVDEKPRTLPNANAIAVPPVTPKEAVAADSVAAPPSVDVPIYKVLMPPLIFNAADPGPPPDPGPETIILVRSVHAQEDTVYSGTVEPKGARTESPSTQKNSSADSPHSGILARIGGFFRRVFGVSTGPGCAGAGCK